MSPRSLLSKPLTKLTKADLLELYDYLTTENAELKGTLDKMGYTVRVWETHGKLAIN